MTVRELIAELSKYPPDAEMRFEAACIVDDEEDCLVGSVKGVYAHKTGLCVIDCDGVSAEDRKILDGRDEDFESDEDEDFESDEDDFDDEDEEDDGE